MDKKNIVGDRFRAVREQLGITQKKLGERLLISRNYVAKIESGAQEPSARIVRDLEGLLVDPVNKPSTFLEETQEAFGRKGNPGTALLADFEGMIVAAGTNRDRLGWLRVQLDQMRVTTRTWLELEEINRRAVERARKMTAEANADRAAASLKHDTGSARAS